MLKAIYYFLVCLILLPAGLLGQIHGDISNHILRLHAALVSRDTIALHHFLDDQLTYGHSNGWIETKQDLIKNNFVKKLIYESISEDSISVQLSGSVAVARFNAIIKGVVADQAFHLKLHVCQTWIRDDLSWKLMARQAVKLEAMK